MWSPSNQTKQNEIIYVLMRGGNEPKRFEALRSLCEKELKSRTTFDLYLKNLVREGKVIRTVKSRKNVLYQLNARNPEIRTIMKQEEADEASIDHLLANLQLPKWPKPKSEEERRAQFCEDFAALVADGFRYIEYFFFRFIDNKTNPRGYPVSYLEFVYQKAIGGFFKVLTRGLEKLSLRDPKQFKHAHMALRSYRDATFLSGRLLCELTGLESAGAFHMKQDDLSKYKHELAERIQRVYGSRNWLENGPYRKFDLPRGTDYVTSVILQWMNYRI